VAEAAGAPMTETPAVKPMIEAPMVEPGGRSDDD